jgi:hypothetical protein
MKAQNLSTSLGEGRDVAPSLALPSQNPNLTVYTEELTHLCAVAIRTLRGALTRAVAGLPDNNY